MLSNHLILCQPLLLLSSIFPIIRVFSNELTLRIRWPKYWRFSFSNSCCCYSVTQSCLTLCDPMYRSTPGFPVLHHLPELTQTLVHWVSYAIQPSHHLSSPSPPGFNLSQDQVFSNESALCISYSSTWLKYWSFSFSISLSNEYSGLISFRMDWFDLLAVQGTLKSLLQHHSSKTSILRTQPFLMVQLSHLYMTTR